MSNGEGETLSALALQARLHATELHADVSTASTRMEHIRLTMRAGEAERIAAMLERIAQEGATDV